MRRRLAVVCLIVACGLGTVAVVACDSDTTNAAEDAGAARRDAGADADRDSGPDPSDGDILDSGPKPPGKVYAHTPRALYLFEPIGRTLTNIGALKCFEATDSLLDLAVDKDGVIYGTSNRGFLKIESADASCVYVKTAASGTYPNALTFVPAGVLDPTQEVLVGYSNGTSYVRIDVTTGEITSVGELNAPDASARLRVSGDLVSMLRGGTRKTYLTVRAEVGDAAAPDRLAEIDPVTGRVGAVVAELGHKNLFGFAQWAGSGYGFDGTGNVIAVDLANGSSSTIMTLPADAGAGWFGAGVTTTAPSE